jgi:hypothetical protein
MNSPRALVAMISPKGVTRFWSGMARAMGEGVEDAVNVFEGRGSLRTTLIVNRARGLHNSWAVEAVFHRREYSGAADSHKCLLSDFLWHPFCILPGGRQG